MPGAGGHKSPWTVLISVSGHHLVPGAENMLRPQCLRLGS